MARQDQEGGKNERVLVLGVVDNSPRQTHQHGRNVLAVEWRVRRNLPRNFGEHSHSEFRPLELQGGRLKKQGQLSIVTD
jgi:hypothetical protein